MARSKRDQRVELQQAASAEQGTTAGQWQPQASALAGAPLSGTQSVRNEAGADSFSKDPSPFSSRPALSPESSAYRELVATAAYYRAERRAFAPGGEIEDWLQAEREVAARIGAVRATTHEVS